MEQDRIEIAPSPWKILLLIALSAGFIALGFWLVATAEGGTLIQFLGWVLVLFFGACGILWIVQSIRYRGAVVVIDRDGILDRRVSDAPIPWTKVEGVSTWTLDAQRFVILKLDEAFDHSFPTKAITRWTRGANKKLGADGITINPTGLQIGFDALLNAVVKAKTASDERHAQS
ncbi:MAG: STM3941 family protein [Beijerinckiaceae bacterium]